MERSAGYLTLVVVVLAVLLPCTAVVHASGAGDASGGGTAPVTLLLQLSDLHLSRFHHTEDSGQAGSRAEDLELFAELLLSAWRPDAIVITGDLTDAKLPTGRGEQQKAEWREYKRAWRKLADAAGLPESRVLDVRGNHDVFDTVRGGPADHYSMFSARAARVAGDLSHPQGPTARVYVDALLPAASSLSLQPGVLGRGGAAAAAAVTPGVGAARRTTLVAVEQQGQVGDSAADEAWAGGAVEMVGRAAPQRKHTAVVFHWSELRRRAYAALKHAGLVKPALHSPGAESTQHVGTKGSVVGSTAREDATLPAGRQGTAVGGATTLLPHSTRTLRGASVVQQEEPVPTPTHIQHGQSSAAGQDQSPRGATRQKAARVLQSTDAPKATRCPSVVLVGVDATPSPGLRNPTNFLGVVGPDLLHQLDHELSALHSQRPHGCPAPHIIAYGHQTLSTLAYGRANVLSPSVHCNATTASLGVCASSKNRAVDAAATAGNEGATTRIEGVLARWGVSAYLCGHLHDTFGHRLHRLHPKPRGTGWMAELEMSDWKLTRHFRLLTTDAQGGVSFADLRFVRDLDSDSDGEEPVAVAPVDVTRRVRRHLVLLTSPPDARYSPITSAVIASPTGFGGTAAHLVASDTLRALVLLMPGAKHAGSHAALVVRGVWHCAGAGGQVVGELALTPSAVQAWVYEADLSGEAAMGECTGHVHTQVVVSEGGGDEPSSSELRPIRLPPSHVRAVPGQLHRHEPDTYMLPMDLGLKVSEMVILGVDWPMFGARVFALLWALLVGVLLLLPRMAGHTVIVTHTACYHFCLGRVATPPPNLSTSWGPGVRPGELRVSGFGSSGVAAGSSERPSSTSGSPTHAQSVSVQGGGSPSYAAAGGVSGAGGAGALPTLTGGSGAMAGTTARQRMCGLSVKRAVHAAVFPVAWTSRNMVARPLAVLLLCALWPLRDLARVATAHADLWAALLAFALNLGLGPWVVARFSTHMARWCIMTAHALYCPGPSGGLVAHELHDVSIVTNVHLGTCILPAILWLASVVSFWMDSAAAGKLSGARLLTLRHTAGLFVLVPLHCWLQNKMAHAYGAGALLTAPATGWVLPLAWLWLRAARMRVTKARTD